MFSHFFLDLVLREIPSSNPLGWTGWSLYFRGFHSPNPGFHPQIVPLEEKELMELQDPWNG